MGVHSGRHLRHFLGARRMHPTYCCRHIPARGNQRSEQHFQESPMFLRQLVATSALVMMLATACQAAIRVEAYRGEPFGIGRVTIDLSPGASTLPWSDDRFALVESDDRVLYPVIENASVAATPSRIPGHRNAVAGDVLFHVPRRRAAPPHRVHARRPATHHSAGESRGKFNKLQDDWWNATEDRFQRVFRQAEYPVLVENYLTATWARRLDREMPEPHRTCSADSNGANPGSRNSWPTKPIKPTSNATCCWAASTPANKQRSRFPTPPPARSLQRPGVQARTSHRPRTPPKTSPPPLPTSDRTPRRARPARMLLPALRQLPELPLVPRLHAATGRATSATCSSSKRRPQQQRAIPTADRRRRNRRSPA